MPLVRIFRWPSAALVVPWLLVAVLAGCAESPAVDDAVAEVVLVTGDATVQRGGGGPEIAAVVGMRLAAGDIVSTGGGVVRIAYLSTGEIQEARADSRFQVMAPQVAGSAAAGGH